MLSDLRLGYILSEDVVVNYKDRDRDDSLHFLTHIDSNCTDIADYISPTAKRIYTSHYNAWYIKKRFKGKLIDVSGFNTDTSYKVTYKGNKYIYTFIDSKFATGSVALLLHGSFGTYLYTGNFSYYSAFVKSPVLLPVIEEKALTRIYLDNTYYEQPVDFLGFDELTDRIAKIIRSQPKKRIYLFVDQVNTCPLLAEIASKVQEKVYICHKTLMIMTVLRCGSLFTCDARESRILVCEPYINKRGHDENISIQITRHDKTNENSTIFPKNVREGNSYNFHYYCHSNHKEICELLSILKPESTTCLFSDLDKSKVNYNLDFKSDTFRTRLFKSFSDKSTCNSLSVEDAIKNNKEIGGSTTHENENTNVNSMALIRVLEVAEINSSVSDVTLSNEGSISLTSNASLNEEIANKYLTSNTFANSLITQNLHNYCKTKQTNNTTIKIYKPPGDGFNQTNAIPRDGKQPNVRKTQIALPLVIDRKLVKDNNVTNLNNKLSLVPKTITTEKKSVLLDRNYIASKNSHSVESCNENSKSNNLESANTEIIKKQLAFNNKSKIEEVMASKTCYKPLHQPILLALNMSSSQTPETINNSESSPTNIISQNCIPDQEVFERNADKPGMAKKNTQESVSANQDLQENNKIGEVEDDFLNNNKLSPSDNSNGCLSNETNNKDSCGIIENQSASVDSISDISNSPSKAVRPTDTSSSTDHNKIGEVEDNFFNNNNLLHVQNNNGSMSDIQKKISMDEDSCGTLERQSMSVDCSSGISNSPSEAVRPTDTSSSTDHNKIGEVEDNFFNNNNLLHVQNNNGSMSDIQKKISMDEDSCGTLERQSMSVDCSSGISNSPSKAVRPTDTSSSTDVTITHMHSADTANSMVSNSQNVNNQTKNLDGGKKKTLKRAISVSVSDDEFSNCRKKLRSEDLRINFSDSNKSKQDIKDNLKHCFVILKRNDVERSYFFSRYHKCHMKKFCGFKKHEVRPRQHLSQLRNLRKRIEQLGSK